MPKRKSNQNNKKKKNKNKTKQQRTCNNNNTDSNIDYDAIIESQINNGSSNQSHSSISTMLQQKIAQMEKSKKRQENAALFKKNNIKQQMNMMKQQYESKQDIEYHRNEMYQFIHRINDIFYDVLENETSLKTQSSKVIQHNETLKKLCQKLQEDKKLLTANINEIEQREKKWRNEIEGKFQNSLADIKDKIGNHEEQYNAVVDENKKLRGQLKEFLDYDKKRSADFELYKEHQIKLDEIHNKEKINYSQMIEKEKEQTFKLSANMKQAIEVNELLKVRCNQYETKFGEMAKTVKESSKCIDEYKKMNVELMKQNKTLHNRLNDVVSKYKQLNGYNDQLNAKNVKSEKRMETLSELCRKLQVKNKEFSDDLKMAKSSLFNQGVTLTFKSDASTKKKDENEQQQILENERNGKEETVENECVSEEDVACLDEDTTESKLEDITEGNEQSSSSKEIEIVTTTSTNTEQAATF